jgi:putative aldouronate transport system permease protein
MLTSRMSRGEKIFQSINLVLLLALAIATLFPFLYVVSVSLTPLEVLAKYGSFQVIPRVITFDAYRYLLSTGLIPRAFLNSVTITVLGTTVNLVLTTLTAYPLSRKRLPGRTFWLVFVLIPMLFSGGLVPLFILVRSLGLLNTYWAVVLPGAIWTYNLLVMKSFFESLPEEILESARIDGANDFRILIRIVLPLSKPVLATLGLFYAVGHWNGFFYPLMFLSDAKLQPLQVILRNVLLDLMMDDLPEVLEKLELLPGQTLKMAAIVLSVLPLLVVYPWIQKYFTKGVLLGAIKG